MIYEKVVELSELCGINQTDVNNLVKLAFDAQIEPNKSSPQDASKADASA